MQITCGEDDCSIMDNACPSTFHHASANGGAWIKVVPHKKPREIPRKDKCSKCDQINQVTYYDIFRRVKYSSTVYILCSYTLALHSRRPILRNCTLNVCRFVRQFFHNMVNITANIAPTNNTGTRQEAHLLSLRGYDQDGNVK